MRIVVQRVSRAAVTVDGSVVGTIGRGLVLLVGSAIGDSPADVTAAVDKISHLRVFEDPDGKMNLSIMDTGGDILLVSQFTLLADVRRGRRPSFTKAAPPEAAAPLIESMVNELVSIGVPTATGVFGAKMELSLVNDGPVTIVVDVNDGVAG